MLKRSQIFICFFLLLVATVNEAIAQNPDPQPPATDAGVQLPAPATQEQLSLSYKQIKQAQELYVKLSGKLAQIQWRREKRRPYDPVELKAVIMEVKNLRELIPVLVINDLRLRIQHINNRNLALRVLKPRLDLIAKTVDTLLEDLPGEMKEIWGSWYEDEIGQAWNEAAGEVLMEAYYREYSAVSEFYGGIKGVSTFAEYTLGHRVPNPMLSEVREVESSWIVSYLASLADRLVALRPEIRSDDDIPDDVEEFLAKTERKVILTEFKRLAFNAVIVNPETHQPIEGKDREYLGIGIMVNLVEYIQYKVDNPSDLEWILDWFGSARNAFDSREDYAKEVASSIPSNLESKITALAGSVSEPTPTEYFLILAHVLATESYKDIQQYRDEFLGADDTFWNRNLETYIRTNTSGIPLSITEIFGSSNGQEEVEKRLDEYLKSGEKLAKVFQRAAATNNNPDKLQKSDQELLEKFGYLIRHIPNCNNPKYKDSGGTRPCEPGKEQLAYHIPRSNRGLGEHFVAARKDLALPEASFLSAVSPKEIAIIVAAAVVPEYAATLVAAELRAIGVSGLTQAIGRFAADRLVAAYVGTAIDAAKYHFNEDPNKGPFDPSVFNKHLLEALILDSVQEVAGKFSNEIMGTIVREGAWESGSPKLRKFLAQAIQDEPSTAKSIYEFTRSALGIVQTTAIQYSYQSLIEGQQIDSHQLMMMAFRAALTKSIARSGEVVSEYLASNKTPKFLRDALAADPQLRAETIRNLERSIQERSELLHRFAEVVEQQGDSAESRFKENMRGEFSWAETVALFAEKKISKETQTKLAEFRLKHFDKIVHSARILALAEINRNYPKFLKRALERTDDPAEAEAFAKQRRRYEVDLVMADLFAPGSDSIISDIDRSTGSVYLRKHLVGMWEAHQRMKNDGVLPTSARAFDVNEYINVFMFIKENRKYVKDLKTQTTGPIMRSGSNELIADGDFGDLNMAHGSAMIAIAMSGAMRGMTSDQRPLYVENLREWMINDAIREASRSQAVTNMPFAERTAYQENLRTQLLGDGPSGEPVRALNRRAVWAQQHLSDSEARLAQFGEQLQGERPADHPDIILEAKDQLYQERMEAVNDLQFDLSILEQDEKDRSARALKLRGKVERLMAIAMRDGIQTYTHTVGLDIIVNGVQAKKIQLKDENGAFIRDESGEIVERKAKVADRLDDPDFVLGGEGLKYDGEDIYSREDIEGIIHDQVMFIIEHINHFNAGAENEAATGRALGKYVERFFLAQKILGLDIKKVRSVPESNPTRRLLEISQAIVRNKGDLAEILRILQDASRRNPPSPKNGIAELFYLVEKTIPGMHGMANLAAGDIRRGSEGLIQDPSIKYEIAGKFMAGMLAQALFAFREEKKMVAEIAGHEGVVILIDEKMAAMNAELVLLEEQVQAMLELAKVYRAKDWDLIYRFAPEVSHWKGMMASLPWQSSGSQTWTNYKGEHYFASLRMTRLMSGRGNISVSEIMGQLASDPKTPEYRRLKNRIEFLNRLLTRLTVERWDAEEKAQQEAIYAQLNLGGTWACEDTNRAIGDMVIVHSDPEVLNITFPYTGRDLVSSVLRAEADYLRGKIRGVFRDESQPSGPLFDNAPPTMTSILFEASINPEGTEIDFSKGTSEYDGVAITWSMVICTPKSGAAAEQAFISTGFESLSAFQANNKLSEQAGYLEVETLSPDGTRTPADHMIRVGRQRISGPWLPAGSYRVLVTLNESKVSANVSVQVGSKSRLTLRTGGIMWHHSGPFMDSISPPRAEIVEAAPPHQRRYYDEMIGAKQDHALLAPGKYKIYFSGPGAIEISELNVMPGAWTKIDVRWSGLKLTSSTGEPFLVSGFHRRTDVAEESIEYIANSRVTREPEPVQEINMSPGEYVVTLVRGTEIISKEISLTEGAVTTVSF